MDRQNLIVAALLVFWTVAQVPGNADGGESRDNEIIEVTYPVSDLPVWRYGTRVTMKRNCDLSSEKMHEGRRTEPEFDANRLIAHIRKHVTDDAWDEMSIVPQPSTASLVIRQTRENHKQIAELLDGFRRHFTSIQKRARPADEHAPPGRDAFDANNALLDRLEKQHRTGRRRVVDYPVGLPADLQILRDSLTRPTVPHRLGRSWEEQEFPEDRDFLYGIPFTR
jgi:hypothetical protein